MPTHDSSRSECQAKVALIVGGGNDPLSEYAAALELCRIAGRAVGTFACNDSIPLFPDFLDHAITLHPDKLLTWLVKRREKNRNDPPRIWAHRHWNGFTDHTRDWQGSSGLFMVKIARELGYTHIIGCGIPMTEEGHHIIRGVRWVAREGFMRGWRRHQHHITRHVRSMSGWTMETFGYPTEEWLIENIPDDRPMFPQHTGVKA